MLARVGIFLFLLVDGFEIVCDSQFGTDRMKVIAELDTWNLPVISYFFPLSCIVHRLIEVIHPMLLELQLFAGTNHHHES